MQKKIIVIIIIIGAILEILGGILTYAFKDKVSIWWIIGVNILAIITFIIIWIFKRKGSNINLPLIPQKEINYEEEKLFMEDELRKIFIEPRGQLKWHTALPVGEGDTDKEDVYIAETKDYWDKEAKPVYWFRNVINKKFEIMPITLEERQGKKLELSRDELVKIAKTLHTNQPPVEETIIKSKNPFTQEETETKTVKQTPKVKKIKEEEEKKAIGGEVA